MFHKNLGDKAEYFAKNIQWEKGKDAVYPFCAKVENQDWQIKVNDYPEQEMFTLIINDKEIINFNNWPKNWHKPQINSVPRAKL